MRHSPSYNKSESEMFLFDPYQKYIQSNNETLAVLHRSVKSGNPSRVARMCYIDYHCFSLHSDSSI